MNGAGQTLALDFDFHVQREMENENLEYVRGVFNLALDFLRTSGNLEIVSNSSPELNRIINSAEDFESVVTDFNMRFNATRGVSFVLNNNRIVSRE